MDYPLVLPHPGQYSKRGLYLLPSFSPQRGKKVSLRLRVPSLRLCVK